MMATKTNAMERHRLPFDPIEEAAKQWATQWGEMPRMRAVTSLMRVHQLLITELDELLRPLGLTFARYEVLVLLSFSRRGALPTNCLSRTSRTEVTPGCPVGPTGAEVGCGCVTGAGGGGAGLSTTSKFVGCPARTTTSRSNVITGSPSNRNRYVPGCIPTKLT